jgi:uncharacterized membrane protein
VKKNYLILLIFIIGFILNLIWEVVQLPLYKGYTSYFDHFGGCFVASIVDAVTVLLIYYLFAWWFGNRMWIKRLNWKKTVLVILLGGAIAVGFEQWAFALDQWGYSEKMPVVPLLNTGLSPLLQLMILPLLSYLLSYKLLQLKRA